MSGDESDRSDERAGEESQARKLQRKREKAPLEQHEAASEPGYTARPTHEKPEGESDGTS